MRTVLALLITLLAAGLAACSEPLAFLPGGALNGVATPVPADWSALANVKTIQVEFRPSEPYSHNVWGVGIDHDLYIATHGNTRWTPFIATDPRVRVRVGTALYDLTAVSVTDGAERARVADAYAQKYEIKKDENWVNKGVIFRLDRRQ